MIQLLLVLFSALNLGHAAQVTQPFLYEIEKNGQIAYMLGTMHADIKLTDLPAFATDKLYSAGTVIIETNIDEVTPLAMALYSKPAPVALNQTLNAAQWQKLVSAFATAGVKEFQLIGAYPGMVLQQYIELQLKNPNFRAAKAPALDFYILDYAQTNGKAVDYLEAAQVQFDILQYTMLDAKVLKEVLDLNTKTELKNYLVRMNIDGMKLQNALNTAYFGGDLDALAKLTTSGMDDKMSTMLIVDRNSAWVAEFNRIIQNPGVEFFAFGAAHLPNDVGVIKLLTDDGFKITRITQ